MWVIYNHQYRKAVFKWAYQEFPKELRRKQCFFKLSKTHRGGLIQFSSLVGRSLVVHLVTPAPALGYRLHLFLLPHTSSETCQTPYWPPSTLPQQKTPFFFLSVWLIKHIKPPGRHGERQSGPYVAVDPAPTLHPVVQAASRVPGGSATSVTRTSSGRVSEKAREEQSKGTADSGGNLLCITSSILFSSQASTSSADKHLPGGCGHSGQVPTSCRVGRRDDVTIRQMRQSGNPVPSSP